MNSYKTSWGERIPQNKIEKYIKEAKREKLDDQLEEWGYNFCEDCGVSSGTYLDCSHDIPVKKCKEEGMTELSWKVKKITIRCRKCHQIHDKLV